MTPQMQPGMVTAADVMREVSGARGELAAANTRLAVIDVRTQSVQAAVNDHEGRIRLLEAFRGKLLGVAVTVSILSGVASGLVGYVVGHLHLYINRAHYARFAVHVLRLVLSSTIPLRWRAEVHAAIVRLWKSTHTGRGTR